MPKNQTVSKLIKELKAKGTLDLYWFEKQRIGVRTLHWVDDEKVRVTYNREVSDKDFYLMLNQFLRILIKDDEAYTNYWLAYGARLRKYGHDS